MTHKSEEISNQDKEQVLESGLEVMQGVYDGFVQDYARTHSAALGLFGVEIAVVTFILQDWNFSTQTFLPIEWAGIWVGALMLIYSFWILRHTVESFVMPKPGNGEDYKDLEKKYKTYSQYLTKIHADYDGCVIYVSRPINKRQRRLSIWMTTAFVGLISLLITKTGILKLVSERFMIGNGMATIIAIIVVLLVLAYEFRKTSRVWNANKDWAGSVDIAKKNKDNARLRPKGVWQQFFDDIF